MGLIHLDAGVIIGFLDADDGHHDAARSVLVECLDAGDRLATAASAFAECLVGPSRRSPSSVQIVRDVIERLPVSVVDLGTEIAEAGALLRARHRTLRLPDALVIATASVAAADRLVTTDRNWPTAKVMKLPFRIDVI